MVCNWLKYDWSNRCNYSYQLLRKVRLGLVESEDIHHLLGPEILGIKECYDLVVHVWHLQVSNTCKDLIAVENPALFMGRSACTVSNFAIIWYLSSPTTSSRLQS